MSGKEDAPALITPDKHWERAKELRVVADQYESMAIKLALSLVGGNVRQAADLLGCPYRTLDRKIREGRFQDLRKHASKKIGRPKSA